MKTVRNDYVSPETKTVVLKARKVLCSSLTGPQENGSQEYEREAWGE